MRTIPHLIVASMICLSLAAWEADGAETESIDPLETYNVIWETPSENHNGSMPIGNGDIGMNVWAERNGDLWLLLSKSDAWSENCRLLKLGRLRVRLSPNPFADGVRFRQALNLRHGAVTIEAGKGEKAVTLTVWADANHPAIHVEIKSISPLDLHAALDVWRTKRRQLADKEVHSAYGLHGAPFPVTVYPDTVLKDQKDGIVWYHRNETSIWENNLRHQGLGGFIDQSADPLLHRTFGGCIEGPGMVSENPTTLKSAAPQKHFILSIYPLCAQTETADEWLKRLEQNVAHLRTRDIEDDRAGHRLWWKDFWNRSWIRVTGSAEGEAVTRGYTLQRWISACAGRGAYPIKFNGTIFTVDGDGFDADYRRWGGPYWWQNTRLPYWPMLACGDFDMMLPLFRMYQDMMSLAKYRTKTWYSHDGAFIGETLLPMCDSLLEFWDKHYETDERGQMRMYPAQALETLQDAANPTPDVAGLHWVLKKLLSLAENEVCAKVSWCNSAGLNPARPKSSRPAGIDVGVSGGNQWCEAL